MNKKVLNSFIIIAFVMICIGIIFAFVDLQGLHIHVKNSGYVGAVFSLSGVLLYFTALMYQIKEYQLQVLEMRKTLREQAKSNAILAEQKNILLEQNTNALIFGMIDSFNEFKKRNDIQGLVEKFVRFYQGKFALKWQTKLVKLRLNHKELNIKFALEIKDILEKTLPTLEGYSVFKKYIQFAYNILYLIDQRSKTVGKDNFTPFFFSQLDTNETIMLYLSNLSVLGMPIYDNLHWGRQVTKEIVDVVKWINAAQYDYKEMDVEILTQEFNKLKQNK